MSVPRNFPPLSGAASLASELTGQGRACCDLCGEPIAQEDISVEAFEIAGCLACTSCLEAFAEQETHQ